MNRYERVYATSIARAPIARLAGRGMSYAALSSPVISLERSMPAFDSHHFDRIAVGLSL